jgi:hypothetical protein
MLIVALLYHDMWFEDLMLPAILHELEDRWDRVGEVKRVPSMLPWTILEQGHSLEDWVAMDIHVHWFRSSKELVTSQVVNHKLLELWNDALKLSDLGFILESGEEGAPEVSINDLVELQHIKSHLSSLHGGCQVAWLGLMWPDGDTLGWMISRSELSNDCRFVDDGTIWSLKKWYKSTIDLLVPFSLDSEVDLALLENYFFGL